ncbi:hypothetical protein ES708_25531 [subsurface metagenome]
MRLLIPLTGRVVAFSPLSGDPDDPIKVINVDLGDISWQAVSFDLENGVVEVEADVPRHLDEDDASYLPRKARVLENARSILKGHTRDELYAMGKSSRLKRPFKEKK